MPRAYCAKSKVTVCVFVYELICVIKSTMSLSALQPFMDSLVSELQQLRSAIGAVQLDADSAGLASHSIDVCPKRTGKPCSFWEKFGRCNFGSRCKLEHAAAAEGKGQGNGQVDLPAPLAASLAVGQSGAKRTQMISCKDKHARGCEPNFVIDLEFYEEKCEKEGWSMPKSCKACREKSKSDRIGAERPVANLFTGHQDDHGDEYDEADDEFWCQDLQMAGLITADAVENVFTSEVTTLSPEVDNPVTRG